MDERKNDEAIADLEDIRTNIETVRHFHPDDSDAILDEATIGLSDVVKLLEDADKPE